MQQVNWEERWSDEGKVRRAPGLLSAISSFSAVPGGIGMHGGLPHPSTFPFAEISYRSHNFGSINLQKQATAVAQQYCFCPHGHPPLVELLQGISERLQQPHGAVKVAVAAGATQAIDCIINLLLNRGDALLCEEFCYSHALEAQFIPRGLELVPVPMDAQGLQPKVLNEILCKRKEAGKKLARVLYTVPRGQNPTGVTMSMARLVELYAVAQEWDLVILEDDAYYWLQQPEHEDGEVKGLALDSGLLSLDVDGRVIRIDTLSKLLGPGFRLGWVTAIPEVTNKIALAIFSSSMGVSSLCQVSIHELLSSWGIAGLDSFVKATQQYYTKMAALHHAAALQHLSEVATWERPRAGMFLWMKLKGDICSDSLLESCLSEGVMMVPGRAFWAGGIARAQDKPAGEKPPPCPFFRISYANTAAEAVDEGYTRLRNAIDACVSAAGACDAIAATCSPAADNTVGIPTCTPETGTELECGDGAACIAAAAGAAAGYGDKVHCAANHSEWSSHGGQGSFETGAATAAAATASAAVTIDTKKGCAQKYEGCTVAKAAIEAHSKLISRMRRPASFDMNSIVPSTADTSALSL